MVSKTRKFHAPPPKEISFTHDEVTKSNNQHQVEMLYVPDNVFEHV